MAHVHRHPPTCTPRYEREERERYRWGWWGKGEEKTYDIGRSLRWLLTCHTSHEGGGWGEREKRQRAFSEQEVQTNQHTHYFHLASIQRRKANKQQTQRQWGTPERELWGGKGVVVGAGGRGTGE